MKRTVVLVLIPVILGAAVLSLLLLRGERRSTRNPISLDHSPGTSAPRADVLGPGASPETPVRPAGPLPSASIVRLPEWVDRLRKVDRTGPRPEDAYEAVRLLMEELSAWIGEDEGRLREVALLVRTEQDVNLWAPALFAISRSPAPGKRRFLLEVIRSDSDSDKVWHAVLAGFEGGAARGFTSLPSCIKVAHTDHHDPDLVKAAVDQLLRSTDEPVKFWVAQALESAAHRDDGVRQAMITVFASPNESEELRARLADTLSFAATKDSGVFDAARFILQDPGAGEQLLTACVDLMGVVDKIESANVLTDVLIAETYPETVRSRAARMIRESHFAGDARVVESVLAAYAKQPVPIRKDILAVLEESGSAGVAARIRAMPAEQDEQLRLYREQVVASLERKAPK